MFERATRRAGELGISRSQFFAVATRRYLDALDSESVTAAIDAALDVSGADDSGVVAVAAGRSRLSGGDDW